MRLLDCVPWERRGAMKCRKGRVRLKDDEDRRLFSESGAFCLLCPSRCSQRTRSARSASQSPNRGTGAHRSPQRRNASGRSLCCPVSSGRSRKPRSACAPPPTGSRGLLDRGLAANEASTTATRWCAPAVHRYSPHELRRGALARERLLRRNRLLFQRYGPVPLNGSTSSHEAARAWSARVVDEIVPNNRVLVTLVEVNDRRVRAMPG